MAFPAIYDFNYYKGDTFEFRIYPKKNDGTVFDLSQYYMPTNFANTPDYFTDLATPYDSAQFTISTVRGDTGSPIRCYAKVSDDGTFVQCAIRPTEGIQLNAGTEYVYDVEVRKPATVPGSVSNYEIVQTLLTGTITITDQVTGATTDTRGPLTNRNIRINVPVTGANPATEVVETAEYRSTSVVWSPTVVGSKFASNTNYTATITLQAKSPYSLTGIPTNFFTVEGSKSSINDSNSGVITVEFPITATTISEEEISGILIPVIGEEQQSFVDPEENSQYSIELVWYPEHEEFLPETEYALTAILTPKTENPANPTPLNPTPVVPIKYTLMGVPLDFFSISGFSNVKNLENSGVVTARIETGEE
jgi:hypothetical protein